MASPAEGYALRESDGFLTKARWLLGAVERWDEMRWGLDWALSRSPTDPSFAIRLAGNLWVTQTAGPPELVVLYEVNESERVVTYVGLSPTP